MNGGAEDAADPDRRKLLQQVGIAAGGLALAGVSYPFLLSLVPSRRVRALGGPVEADLSKIAPGALATLEWRGKPVWIVHRTPDMLARLQSVRTELSDPDSKVSSQQPRYAANAARSVRPEFFVSVGLCTHLGCVPTFQPAAGSLQPGWPGGFYCPCHGSKFDLAGRVFSGSPAPINLLVPRYSFASPQQLVIGRDSEGEAA
ncbi:MAG TPA: ubiquinol-cytochrome c reductase iron-sulfur subunit [Burkholderiales bacterium]|jgi:ubiquinol-cytochrome c reductase iron-sulfur subunit